MARKKYRKLNSAYWATKKTKDGFNATYIPKSMRGDILPLAKKTLASLEKEIGTLSSFISRLEGTTDIKVNNIVETLREHTLDM